jgi:hypothetical protein
VLSRFSAADANRAASSNAVTPVAGESASCCLQGNPLLNIGLIYSFFKKLFKG